jgi:xanthine dehydrogenase YagR molybdenum-binding subunit
MKGTMGVEVSRTEGPDKVSGAARYAADRSAPGLVYGVFAPSRIARGRIEKIHSHDAETSSGILRVLTHQTMPKLKRIDSPPGGQSVIPLQDDRIWYEGQPIALVIGETLEQAQYAASLIGVEYTSEPAIVDFQKVLERAREGTSFGPPDTHVGDVERGLTQADVTVEATYFTADRHHSPMEPSATVAEWHDGELTLHDSTQWVWGVRAVVAAALGMQPERVHVRGPFVGGGFGCKGYIWPHQILTAAAARELGRPLKVVLTRANTFTSHGYQPASRQQVSLGATRQGKLTAIRHCAWTPTSQADGYVEYAAITSRSLYACLNIQTQHRIVAVDRSTPTPMRAPHEGLAGVGIECAMDELAAALEIDPVELRLRNYAENDPTSGKPFSSKALRDCYQQAAERFGWKRRQMKPRSMNDGHDLIGWGMATGMMQTFRFPSKARVSLDRGGSVLVEAGAQEIGTGLFTILPQIAAEVFEIPVERVRLLLGDTTLPETGGTFGSSATIGVGSAVYDAATKLKARVMELSGGAMPKSPAGFEDLISRHGAEHFSVESDWSSRRIEQRIGLAEKIRTLSAEGSWSPGPDTTELGEDPRWSMHTWGAVFVEVRLDEDFMIPRVTRVVGSYSAGRIINPKTARSQLIGGVIWGIGQALLEHSAMDQALGRYLSKNLAGYLVPVNADVPELDLQFVEEFDKHASLLGARGIGELAATGVGPAVANAVWHATGVRVRELPIRPEYLLSH